MHCHTLPSPLPVDTCEEGQLNCGRPARCVGVFLDSQRKMDTGVVNFELSGKVHENPRDSPDIVYKHLPHRMRVAGTVWYFLYMQLEFFPEFFRSFSLSDRWAGQLLFLRLH